MTDQPDYKFWWGFTEIYDFQPAFLLCGLEPQNVYQLADIPPRVQRMMELLLAEVPYRDRSLFPSSYGADLDTALGGLGHPNITWRTKDVFAWAEANGYLAHQNKVLVSPSDAGRIGGQAPKYNLSLQDAVNRIISAVRKERGVNTRPTARAVLEYVKNSGPLELGIPNCDEIYADGKQIVWKDRQGRECNTTVRALEPYVNRANNST